jgi:hypothetical protein
VGIVLLVLGSLVVANALFVLAIETGRRHASRRTGDRNPLHPE